MGLEIPLLQVRITSVPIVFSLKKKSHSVILSFIHSFIHLFRQAVKLTYTYTHSPIQYTCRISSAEPTTYRPTQKLKIWAWVGFETAKLSSSQSSLLLAYSFYIHFLPSFHPSFPLSLLTYLLTYLLIITYMTRFA